MIQYRKVCTSCVADASSALILRQEKTEISASKTIFPTSKPASGLCPSWATTWEGKARMKYRNHVGSSIHDIIQNQFNFGSEAQLRKGICLCCEVVEFSECIYSNLKCVAFGLFPHWNKHFQRTVRIVAKQAIPSVYTSDLCQIYIH